MTLYGTTYKYDHTCEKGAFLFIPTLSKCLDFGFNMLPVQKNL